MRTIPLLSAVIGFCASAAMSAAAPPAQLQAERYIVDSEHEWAESVATSNASVVERILADDLVWVLDSRVLDKRQAVRFAREGPGDFLSNKADYVHVRFFGENVAVAQGKETWTKRSGPMRKGSFVWTDTWIKRNGNWQIVNAQDNTVPAN